jgi:hypothetical protein
MAMPYGGGARLDMESLTPSGRKPRNADVFVAGRHSESAPPSGLEPVGQGAFSMGPHGWL